MNFDDIESGIMKYCSAECQQESNLDVCTTCWAIIDSNAPCPDCESCEYDQYIDSMLEGY